MTNLNRITILGNTGQAADTATSENGKLVTRLSIATHKRFRTESGEWQMKTFTADDFIVLDHAPLPATIDSMRNAFDGVSADVAASSLTQLRHE